MTDQRHDPTTDIPEADALEQRRDAVEPPKCGATGLGTAAYYFPRLLKEAFGLKLAMVPGYKGAADANLAIERGEVQCWCGSVQAYFGSEPGRTWKVPWVSCSTRRATPSPCSGPSWSDCRMSRSRVPRSSSV